VPLPSLLVMMLEKIEPKVGKVFEDTNLRKEWVQTCAATGLGRIIEVKGKKYEPRYEGLTIHFRRSAVRNLINAGVPEKVAMSIAITKRERYSTAITSFRPLMSQQQCSV